MRKIRRCAWVVIATMLSISVRANTHPAPEVDAKPFVLIEEFEPVRFSSEGNPPDVTPDGRWLAFGVTDRASRAERLVYVRDMTTGATRCLTDRDSKDGWATGPRWSPDGRWLAFFVKRDGRPRLALWDRLKDHTEVVLDAPTPGLPMSVSWSERSSTVFVVTDASAVTPPSSTPAPPSPMVTTWRSIAAKKVDEAATHKATSSDRASAKYIDDGVAPVNQPNIIDVLPAHDVWQISLDEGHAPTVHRLVRGAAIEQIAASPDGKWLAIFGNKRVRSKGGIGITVLVDLYVVRLTTPAGAIAPKDVAEGTWTTAEGQAIAPTVADVWQDVSRNGLSWAPDSSAIAYVSGGTLGSGDIFVVTVGDDLPQTRARNLTKTIPPLKPSPAFAEDGDVRFPKFTFGNRKPNGAPLWTADGKALVRAGGEDVWYVPADGEGTPRNLTAKDGARHRFISVLGRVDPSGIRQVIDEGPSVLVYALDTESFREAIWRLPVDGGAITKWFEGEGTVDIGKGYGDIIAPTGDLVTTRSSFNVPGELWTISGASAAAARQLTSLNGRPPEWLARLVRHDLRWKTPAGRPARGALILPPSWRNGGHPPVLMHGYPGQRMATNGRHFGVQHSLEAFALLASGYAVFIVDIPMPDWGVFEGTGGRMMEIVNSVEAAVAAAVKTGLIDESRIAVHGHSHGGQMVNTLLARSTRFAAGIAGSGTGNLVSFAGTSVAGMYYFENSQGSMGTTLWGAPDRYIANSPVFFLDRVRAPLLLYHGEKDSLVSISEAEQMYRGLARLSEDVTLLRYRDVYHTFTQSDVKRDLWTRILAWLDSRLAARSQSSY